MTLSRSGAARDPSSALKEDLFATAYHLPLNHVQDDWEVGVHDVLARGRHVRLRKPVAGLLQVHEDLLLERTQARTDQEALLYKRAGSQEAPYRSQNSEGWKTATLTQEVPGEGGGVWLRGAKSTPSDPQPHGHQGFQVGCGSQTGLKANGMSTELQSALGIELGGGRRGANSGPQPVSV